MIATKINSQQPNETTFRTIDLPEADFPKRNLRFFITLLVTVFIIIIVFFDQLLTFGSLVLYWLLFAIGMIFGCLTIGSLLFFTERHQQQGETWAEKWGEEIGWPIMILAFTLQFLFPQIRPLILGAILSGSWFIVFWNRRKRKDTS